MFDIHLWRSGDYEMDASLERLSPGQAQVLRTLRQMENDRSFGGIELKIENGHVVIMRVIKTERFAGRDTRDGGGNEPNHR